MGSTIDSTPIETPAREPPPVRNESVDDTVRQSSDDLTRALQQSLREVHPPAHVPGYAVLKCLGEGAYGSVWMAREENTGKPVAIKFYTHRGGLDWSLLNREVEKLAVLSTSRNIVRLLAVGWDADPPHYVMEYLENGSLADLLASGPIPVHEAVRIARSVLSALVHAHGSGILHCDLKPANVLLDSHFEPRLGDFGQSRLSYEQNPALGTLFYMAPEQADLNAVPDARWDVYALGALLYQMLCGRPPHRTAENEQKLQAASSLEERLAAYRRLLREESRPTELRRRSGVDRRLANLVDRCLAVDPAQRFPNAQAVLDQLELRDRQRARRPMIALGIVGPALLLLAMTPIVGNAMKNAVASARHNLTERALESDALSARILARSLERELEDRTAELRSIAESEQVQDAVRHAAGASWPERQQMLADLTRMKVKVDETRSELGRPRDTSWFLTDRRGVQRWRHPYDEKTIDKSYAWRDYYRGLKLDPDGTSPDDPGVVRASHLSEPFRSQATRQYMVAISVPVWDADGSHVIGVLARTMHLEELLSDYERRLRMSGGEQVTRVIALADSRNWELLDHPWMTRDNLRNGNGYDPLHLPPETIRQMQLLLDRADARQAPKGLDRSTDYADPVARVDRSYAGPWLAAFSPVGQTGWLAIVQEHRGAAHRPVEQMESELESYGVVALLVACGLIGFLWYFVSRALGERDLADTNRQHTARGGLS